MSRVASRVVRGLLSAVLLAGLPLTQLLSPSAAAADVTSLCTGYAGCAQEGMSDAGYARASGSMFWRMYAGHNCTNYAAYRMVQSGLPNTRPWDGGGNATNWGTSMPSITDDVPGVGAVAWWRAGVYPAGSVGHVAYVERVVSATTIIVSQDSWGGDFSWARITKGSRGWPSGFIHFNDVPLTQVEEPTLSGTAKVGATLTATAGSWTPTPNLAYQWRAGGADIPGATAPTFTLGQDQVGQRIRAVVTASKLGYATVTAMTPRTGVVLPGTLQNTTAPRIDGDPIVESTLTLDPGSWEPAPDSLSIQWLADGVPIDGALGEQLTPDAALLGKALSAVVTASRSGFADVSVTSPATNAVTPAQFGSATGPVVDGTPRVGEELALDTGAATPAGSPTVQWLRNGKALDGAVGPAYVPTTADLGARLSALVRWERPGYVALEAYSPATGAVKAVPTIKLRLGTHAHRLRIWAKVLLPDGVAMPEEILLRSGRLREPLPLVDGKATTVLRDLRPGTRTVRVVVRGSGTTTRATQAEDATIR